MERCAEQAPKRGELGQQIDVARDEVVLGDHAHRIARFHQHLEAAARDAELPLDRLIGIGDAAEHHHLRLPALLRQLLAQELGRVLLDQDAGLEVEAGGEAEVLVGGAGVAVVADHTVGDEVLGPGGDVAHRQLATERLDRGDAQRRLRPHRLTLDVAVAGDGGGGRAEEAEMLGGSAGDAERVEVRVRSRRGADLFHEAETQGRSESLASARILSSVFADAEHSVARSSPPASNRAGQKTSRPVERARGGPGGELLILKRRRRDGPIARSSERVAVASWNTNGVASRRSRGDTAVRFKASVATP